MSETPTNPAPEAPKPEAPKPTQPATDAPAQAPIDWQAESRKWEARAKENKTAADELAALKAAQMTEAEKAAARTADLEARVKGYETKEQVNAWKAEVSKETGVPAEALAGSTRDEIAAHAAVLKSLITSEPQALRGPVVPTEGTGEPPRRVTQLSENDLKSMTPEQINQARREGRLNTLLGVS